MKNESVIPIYKMCSPNKICIAIIPLVVAWVVSFVGWVVYYAEDDLDNMVVWGRAVAVTSGILVCTPFVACCVLMCYIPDEEVIKHGPASDAGIDIKEVNERAETPPPTCTIHDECGALPTVSTISANSMVASPPKISFD